ncbi:pantoate--beta-alanine ligase [Leptobacterium flavescens]|uniref:Pantothenate synthetase n=1 Tax=Leptobacterium flavescens TaxID=472055 RepID=A0A6P0UR48_9FLAO|nr:pantoate--beta-alanine ligase [Leptobacterium flavescens]NER14488.1 pantoate--beta-alanine ligase [Leptobacterium flavescens]
MDIFQHKSAIKSYLQSFNNQLVGLVPTMGALHAGHLSLIEQSLKENDVTVISIFINPTQFNNAEDLKKYPRNLDKDLDTLRSLSNDIVVFCPEADEMYGDSLVSEKFDFDGLEFEMEGRFRTGHFDGVGTIVKKLFEAVDPDNAYFGEKDFQQLQIIRTLVKKHRIPVNIVGCPIKREENGLAMSSRNERLSPEQREKASMIYACLKDVRKEFGTKSALELEEWVIKYFDRQSLFSLEYFEIADEETLKKVKSIVPEKRYRAFIAVYANDIRLIDNIALN